MPKCKHCNTKFEAKFFLQKFCMSTDECRSAAAKFAIEYSKKIQIAKDNREWQREKKVRKEALLSHSEWLNLFQKVFNTYIRTRDKNSRCISCGTSNGQMHCGHYRAVSVAPQLRFNEDNCAKQCARCNTYLSGNLINYRIALIEKIGLERVEKLENDNSNLKISIPEIKEKIKEYKEKIKTLV